MTTSKRDITLAVFDHTLSAGLGLFIAALGTTIHRQWQPYTLIALLVTIVIATIMLRAWRGLSLVIPFGAAIIITVQVLMQSGPGETYFSQTNPSATCGSLGQSRQLDWDVSPHDHGFVTKR